MPCVLPDVCVTSPRELDVLVGVPVWVCKIKSPTGPVVWSLCAVAFLRDSITRCIRECSHATSCRSYNLEKQ